MNILVLSDQTASQQTVLEHVTHNLNDNALLAAFLTHAAAAMRDEISQLDRAERARMPGFLTISELTHLYYDRTLTKDPHDTHAADKVDAGLVAAVRYREPAIESALVTVGQIGHYLGYFASADPDTRPPTDFRILGLCTGVLAGIAIACSRSLSELVPIAVHMVRLSFRTGIQVGRARDVIEPAPVDLTGTPVKLNSSGASASEPSESVDESRSWSTIVAGLTEKEAKKLLDTFHEQRASPLPNRVYISAVSPAAVTISGPPSVLAKLWQSKLEGNNSGRPASTRVRVSIPVYGPYHAGHVHTDATVRAVLGSDSVAVLSQFRPVGPVVHSALTGKLFDGQDALVLVEQAVTEVLFHPLRWDRLVDAVVSLTPKDSEVSIYSIGTNNAANSLVTSLKAAGHASVHVVADPTSWIADSSQPSPSPHHDKIAIVGMSGRFPDAASVEQLWELLKKGLDVHREIPSDRFDVGAHVDPSGKGKNKSHTPYGCFIEEPGLFDPRFFNMSPREAAQTDPMGRLALTTAYEALEMAGFVSGRTPSSKLNRVGTFYGQTSDDWREINAAEQVDTYFITGGVRAFAPGRINYYFKFSGPSYSIDTACSSSLAAIQLACTSLWAGDCDTACAGGLNVLTNPDIFSGLSKGQFLSKTGGCKTFDNGADGYCRADACASVVLKRYADAVADNDNILGCILASGTNHSAEAISITHPHAGAQAELYKAVLGRAGVDAHEVEYVEMHGTGTQAGDGIEIESVTSVFAPRHRQRREDQPLYLGAIKANVGHSEAASGVNSVIKVMKMFDEELIPPNVGIKTVINQSFPVDLSRRNVRIPRELTPFPKRADGARRRVFLNNFSAAGGNTALLLEEGPEPKISDESDPRSCQVVTVSARSMAALRNNLAHLVAWIQARPNTRVSDLAYTSAARRIHHNYRVAVTGSDVLQIADALRGEIQDTYVPVTALPPVAFTFTGQGSQYLGVGRDLFVSEQVFRDELTGLQALALKMGFPAFLPMITGDEAKFEKMTPVATQLGLACLQVALARMWASWGIVPAVVIGHSLGEYAALLVAGVISVSEMIYLVGTRAQMLVGKCTEGSHGMLAVRGGCDDVLLSLGSDSALEVACVNGPKEVVLSGTVANIATAASTLDRSGFRTTVLRVPFAFHSDQVVPILDHFSDAARGVTFRPARIAVMSPLLGRVVAAGETDVFSASYLASHARERVDYNAAVLDALSKGVVNQKTLWVEIGAHSVTSGIVKAILTDKADPAATALISSRILPTLRRGVSPWMTVASAVAGVYQAGAPVDFGELHRPFERLNRLLVLPTYAFDNKRYWLDYHYNWCLTKGEPVAPVETTGPAIKVGAGGAPEPAFSTSCQRIVEERFNPDAQTASVVFESNLADPKLRKIITGHVINGVPLCPSSLNADMAMTAAGYLWKKGQENSQLRLDNSDLATFAGSLGIGQTSIGLNVASMEVHTPLIPAEEILDNGRFLVQIEANADFRKGVVNIVFRSFTSPTTNGKLVTKEHGHGRVLYEDRDQWRGEWRRLSHLVRSQVDQVRRRGLEGRAHTLQRGLVYRLFSSLCAYGDTFRGMSEVVVDAPVSTGSGVSEPEAVAKVQFQDGKSDGVFFCSPYWIDSLCHLSGFVVNSGVASDGAGNDMAYISHGWTAFRIVNQLSRDKEYTSYVRMQPEGKMMVGDVYVLDGNDIVVVVSGLKFQGIPRRALDVMLPNKKKSAVSAGAQGSANRPMVTVRTGPSLQMPAGPAPPFRASIPTVAAPLANPASLVTRAMAIVQTETDVPPSELIDAASFDSLGVDSLMGLTIVAKFREDLDIDVASSVFIETGTIGAFKAWLERKFPGPKLEVGAGSKFHSRRSTRTSSEGHASDSTGLTAPSSAPSPIEKSSRTVEASAQIGGRSKTSGGRPGVDLSIPRTVIATEMGVEEAELAPDLVLADIGMDSLMSLTVLGELRDKLEIDLPADFLVVNRTMSEIETALGIGSTAVVSESEEESSPAEPVKKGSFDTTGLLATSVLLQGTGKAKTKLFLVPDGSGSATSYMSLPAVDGDVAVFALNCPFLKVPEKWTSGIQGLASLYVAEMRRRQPSGPYFVGGWSAGGIIAYEMVVQLSQAGEQVERLFLIDSPCPIKLEPLPARLHEFFDRIGFLGSGPGSAPSWLVPHFQASVKALAMYDPVRLSDIPGVQQPDVVAIWATDGVCGKKSGLDASSVLTGQDPAPMRWLLNDRTDFGDNGWAPLFGKKGRMRYVKVNGHHFGILKGMAANEVASVLRTNLSIR